MKARVLGVCFTITAAISASADQPESSIPCDESAEPQIIAYGQSTEGCSIGETVDLDRFEFLGTAGDQIHLAVDSTGGVMDPLVEMFDPDGLPFFTDSCNNGCTLMADLTLPKTGVYSLNISDLFGDNTGDYVLQIERVPPRVPPPGVAYNTPVNDSIGNNTDYDFFQFQGVAGTMIRIAIDALNTILDPATQVIQPSGAVLDGSETFCFNGCTLIIDLTLEETGPHILRISDQDQDNFGPYLLTINCLIGTCTDIPLGLTADVNAISVSAGGTQNLALDAGIANAGDRYALVGSMSGFTPGVDLGNGLLLPLNPDNYFVLTLLTATSGGLPPQNNFFGTLDASGKANADLTLPSDSNPAFAGLILHHAFLVLPNNTRGGTFSFASNPVSLSLDT